MTIRFSEKFDHLFSHVFIFGNMFPESYGFVAMPVTSGIKDTCSILSLSPIILLMWGVEFVRPCDRPGNETVTLMKHVTKYENMGQWMVEFLRKFERYCIKIVRVT